MNGKNGSEDTLVALLGTEGKQTDATAGLSFEDAISGSIKAMSPEEIKETELLAQIVELKTRISAGIETSKGEKQLTLKQALAHVNSVEKELLSGVDNATIEGELAKVELGLKRVLEMKQPPKAVEEKASAGTPQSEDAPTRDNVRGTPVASPPQEQSKKDPAPPDVIVVVARPATEPVETTGTLVRLQDVAPLSWRIITTLAKPEHQQKIAAVLIIAIGFILRTLFDSVKTGGGSVGFATFGTFFMWTFAALAGLVGLGAGLIVSHRRQQYTLKKILLLVPAAMAGIGFYLSSNLLLSVICATVIVLIGGFWLAGPVYRLMARGRESLRGKKFPRRLAVWGSLGTLVVLGVSCLAFFIYRGDVKIPSFDEKMLGLCGATLLAFIGGMWVLHTKSFWTRVVGSIGLASLVLGATFGALYLFDWKWFWSSEKALKLGAGALALSIITFVLWFLLKPSKAGAGTEPAAPDNSLRRMGSLARSVALLAVGFAIAHFAMGNKVPDLPESALGNRDIPLKSGETFIQEIPSDKYIVKYAVIEGEIETFLNDEPAGKRDKADGPLQWENKVRKVVIKNDSADTATFHWELNKKPEIK